LVPPSVMVVYTPRDEYEVSVCRSLFWASYNFSMSKTRVKSDQPNLPGVSGERRSTSQEPAGVAG
jgi:hypothetical protein